MQNHFVLALLLINITDSAILIWNCMFYSISWPYFWDAQYWSICIQILYITKTYTTFCITTWHYLSHCTFILLNGAFFTQYWYVVPFVLWHDCLVISLSYALNTASIYMVPFAVSQNAFIHSAFCYLAIQINIYV